MSLQLAKPHWGWRALAHSLLCALSAIAHRPEIGVVFTLVSRLGLPMSYKYCLLSAREGSQHNLHVSAVMAMGTASSGRWFLCPSICWPADRAWSTLLLYMFLASLEYRSRVQHPADLARPAAFAYQCHQFAKLLLYSASPQLVAGQHLTW